MVYRAPSLTLLCAKQKHWLCVISWIYPQWNQALGQGGYSLVGTLFHVFHFKPLLSDFSGLLFSGNSQQCQWDHYDFLTEISNNAGMLAILQKVLHGYYIIVYTYCKSVILIVIL